MRKNKSVISIIFFGILSELKVLKVSHNIYGIFSLVNEFINLRYRKNDTNM